MNEIVNKFLLVGDKFMPEMHLRELAFTYSACGYTSYIYKNELDKACFQHDMAYGDFKDLAKRTAADKVLRNKALKIASDQKYDGYQRGLSSMASSFLIKSLVEA